MQQKLDIKRNKNWAISRSKRGTNAATNGSRNIAKKGSRNWIETREKCSFQASSTYTQVFKVLVGTKHTKGGSIIILNNHIKDQLISMINFQIQMRQKWVFIKIQPKNEINLKDKA